MDELDDEKIMQAQMSAVIGKPILLRPSVKLRQQLEVESELQNRSLNNLVIVILERFFKVKTPHVPGSK